MTLLPTANKTKLVKLLRAKGYDVPSGRDARFDRLGRGSARTYVLEWVDSEKRRRLAFYSGCAGRPYLSVGKEWTWLTMSEVIHFGLVEEQKERPPTAQIHRQGPCGLHHEDSLSITYPPWHLQVSEGI